MNLKALPQKAGVVILLCHSYLPSASASARLLASIFFAGRAESAVVSLMKYLEEFFPFARTTVFGLIPNRNKLILSEASRKNPVLSDKLRDAGRELAL